jgi:hypothetical protein
MNSRAISLLLLLPAAAAAQTGAVTGTIDQPAAVTRVLVAERLSFQSWTGRCDAATGTFRVEKLPLETNLDLVVEFQGGLLEGVGLQVPRSEYEEEQPLTDEDRRVIREKVLGLNKFEDVVEVLTIAGNIQHAAVLLNKLRTTAFVNAAPGEVIWRAEIWHFERPEDHWLKTPDDLFVLLHRERIPRRVYDGKAVTFDPALGGLRLSAAKPHVDLGRIELPAAAPGVRLRQRSAP